MTSTDRQAENLGLQKKRMLFMSASYNYLPTKSGSD